MGIKDRLTRLEGATASGSRAEVPIEVRVHLKAVSRHHARARGEVPPPYTREEIEQMHRDDLAEAAGGGVVGHLRTSPAWRDPDAQEILNEWEEDATWRVEQTERLPLGRWAEVYEKDGEGDEPSE